MSVPVRSPDFPTIYPTQQSFDEAIAQFMAVASRDNVAQALTSASSVAEEIPEGFGEAFIRELKSFRAAGRLILRALGARIVSESDGLVETLLLSVPKFNDPASPCVRIDPRHAKHFGHLFKTFGNAVRYIIVAAPNQKPELDKLLSDARVTKVEYVLSPNFNLSIWIQDAHVAFRGRNKLPILCEGVAFNRFEDMSVADDVAAQTKVRAVQSHLYFQGGNVLGGSNVTLIGRDYVWRNTGRHAMPNEQDVLSAFADLFRTDVLALGGKIDTTHKPLFDRGILTGYGLQPIFHIDMYVTPTGVKGGSGKEIVFLGRPSLAKAVTGHYSDFPELDTPLYDRFFDETGHQLETRFEVRPLPLWITYGNLRDPKRRLKFYNLTWNNAIVENDGRTRRVLLPDYTDPEDARIFGVDLAVRRDLQSEVSRVWKEIGFDVRFMDSMEDLAWGDGALHCMTKTLCRTSS